MTSTQTGDPTIREYVTAWQGLDVDEQLGLFWFVYKEMSGSITPAAPGASTVSPEIADGLFNQVKELSDDEQLQFQRDLINKADTDYTRMYGSFGDTTKLLFWYRLAQGMDQIIIKPMSPDYKLSEQAQQLLSKIIQIEYEQQITLFRDYVSPMGGEPRPGSQI